MESFLGYANEFGEAFRSHVPLSIVKLSFGIASTYVLADACNTGLRVYKVSSLEWSGLPTYFFFMLRKAV